MNQKGKEKFRKTFEKMEGFSFVIFSVSIDLILESKMNNDDGVNLQI
jgi:hypothetical protein